MQGRRIAEWGDGGEDLGLRAGMCRWPIGKRPEKMEEQRFCSHPTDKDESYCPAHRKRAYPPKGSR